MSLALDGFPQFGPYIGESPVEKGSRGGSGSGHIEATAEVPAASPEASRLPARSPEQIRIAAREDADKAVTALREAKAALAGAKADTRYLAPGVREARISSWEEQVVKLRPGAIKAADTYFAIASKDKANALPNAVRAEDATVGVAPDDPRQKALQRALADARSIYKNAPEELLEADRWKGEARETPRFSAREADKARDAATRDAQDARGTKQYADKVREFKAAAKNSVFLWENAHAAAAMGGDAAEIDKCQLGLKDALFILEASLKWSETPWIP